LKNFPGASARTPIQKAGEGREGEEEENREGKERRREGASPQIKFYDYSTGSPRRPAYFIVNCLPIYGTLKIL
jgi:hypothetical protein